MDPFPLNEWFPTPKQRPTQTVRLSGVEARSYGHVTDIGFSQDRDEGQMQIKGGNRVAIDRELSGCDQLPQGKQCVGGPGWHRDGRDNPEKDKEIRRFL